MPEVDTEAAIERLMRFLAVEGVTGREARIGKELVAALKEVGVPARAIRFDDAHTRIPVPTETGNLIVDCRARRAPSGGRLLFMTHMDTVPLCAGAKPKRQGKDRQPAKTALGGDNRTGCAVLVTLAAELVRHKLDIRRSRCSSRCARRAACGAPAMSSRRISAAQIGFNFDGRSAADVIIGAVGADRWEAEILGRASHAGVAPEHGISATMILAEALAAVRAGGWFGKVEKDGRKGTSNVGPVGGAKRPGRGRDQCRHRLCPGARREPQPRRQVLQGDHCGLQGGVQQGRRRRDQQRGQGRPRQVHHPHRLLPVPDQGDGAGRQARGGGGRGARPGAQCPGRQRRPRRQLDGAPRHTDRNVRRRPE